MTDPSATQTLGDPPAPAPPATPTPTVPVTVPTASARPTSCPAPLRVTVPDDNEKMDEDVPTPTRSAASQRFFASCLLSAMPGTSRAEKLNTARFQYQVGDYERSACHFSIPRVVVDGVRQPDLDRIVVEFYTEDGRDHAVRNVRSLHGSEGVTTTLEMHTPLPAAATMASSIVYLYDAPAGVVPAAIAARLAEKLPAATRVKVFTPDVFDRFYGVWRVEIISPDHAVVANSLLRLGRIALVDHVVRITDKFDTARNCRRTDRASSMHLYGLPTRATAILVGKALERAGLSASSWRIELNREGKNLSRAVVVFSSAGEAEAAAAVKVRYTWHDVNRRLTWAPLNTPLCFACFQSGHAATSCPSSRATRAAQQSRKAIRDALSSAPANATIIPTRSFAPSLLRTGLSFRDAVSSSVSSSASPSPSAPTATTAAFPALPARPSTATRPSPSSSSSSPNELVAALQRKIDSLSTELAAVKSAAAIPSPSINLLLDQTLAPIREQLARYSQQSLAVLKAVSDMQAERAIFQQLMSVTVSPPEETEEVTHNTRGAAKRIRRTETDTSSSSSASSRAQGALSPAQLTAIARQTSLMIWTNQSSYMESIRASLQSCLQNSVQMLADGFGRALGTTISVPTVQLPKPDFTPQPVTEMVTQPALQQAQ